MYDSYSTFLSVQPLLPEALPSGVECLRKLELERVDAMVEEEVRRISVLIQRVNLYAKLGRGTHNNQKRSHTAQ